MSDKDKIDLMRLLYEMGFRAQFIFNVLGKVDSGILLGTALVASLNE
jgi:hypothetical protein